MRDAFLIGQERRERNRARAHHPRYRRHGRHFIDQNEMRLAAADQLGINLGQQLCIEQRAVLRASAVVDTVASAEVIEAVRGTRVAAARKRQGIYGAAAR